MPLKSVSLFMWRAGCKNVLVTTEQLLDVFVTVGSVWGDDRNVHASQDHPSGVNMADLCFHLLSFIFVVEQQFNSS